MIDALEAIKGGLSSLKMMVGIVIALNMAIIGLIVQYADHKIIRCENRKPNREGFGPHFFLWFSRAVCYTARLIEAMEGVMEKALFVRAEWDEEAAVWVATSDDVPGLVAEADTAEALLEKLRALIPELLEANGYPDAGAVPFELFSRRFDVAHRQTA